MIEPALLQVRGLCKTYQNRTGLFRRQAVEAIKKPIEMALLPEVLC